MLELPQIAAADPAPAAPPRFLARAWRRAWPGAWVFGLMQLPYGVYMGYLQTPLPYLLRRMGFSVDRIGSILAFILLPLTLYFLWSPLVDFWLRRRTWLVALATVSGATLLAGILLLPHHANLAISLLCTGFGINLMTTACAGGLLATTQSEEGKAKAAAWMQGGGLAAQALGGAALLLLSKRLPLPLLATLAALMVAAPALIALTIPEKAPAKACVTRRETLGAMLAEIREMLFCRRSLAGILLLVSPVGSGAAQSLFAAMATDYHVGVRGVIVLNGLLGGVLTMLGAFLAVVAPARWDRRLTYAAAGLLCAGAGMFLVLAPMLPWAYFFGVGLYMLSTGTCYGVFLGLVVWTMGEGLRSASTRFTVLVALGNLPIVYMTRLEGWGYQRVGPRGVPALDAAGNLLVALGVAVWILWRWRASFPSALQLLDSSARRQVFAAASVTPLTPVASALPDTPAR